jgi:hypothetical protein
VILVFRILQSFGLKDTDPIYSVLDVAEDRLFSLFLIPLEPNTVSIRRDNQTINIFERSELILKYIISQRQSQHKSNSVIY